MVHQTVTEIETDCDWNCDQLSVAAILFSSQPYM